MPTFGYGRSKQAGLARQLRRQSKFEDVSADEGPNASVCFRETHLGTPMPGMGAKRQGLAVS